MKTVDRILGEATKRPTERMTPHRAYAYAKHVIKGRWPDGEAILAKDPYWAYCYAADVIKGRWPEAETTIVKHPIAAMNYALDVIKGRWLEAEEAIAKFVPNEEFIEVFTAGKKEYLETFPDAKEDWAMNGWLDWLDWLDT
jgi:hypothetical protein